jgi:phage-related protein
MSVITLCPPTILPTFSEVRTSLASLIEDVRLELHLPQLPTMPYPLAIDFRCFSLEKINLAAEMATMQMLNMLKAFIQPLAGVIGASIDALIPRMPIFDLNILDLIKGVNLDGIVSSVKDLAGMFPPQFPSLGPLFSQLFPIYPQIDIPILSAIQIFQVLVKDYMNTVISIIPNLINKVLGILKLGGTFLLQAIPSIETIVATIKTLLAQVSGYVVGTAESALSALSMVGDSIRGTFNKLASLPLSFPGFPTINIPMPIIPALNIPDFDILEMTKNILSDLGLFLMRQIHNFVTSVLSMLNFQFPKICIPTIAIRH